jgi:O-antigen/teichoic acid export membrane protein
MSTMTQTASPSARRAVLFAFAQRYFSFALQLGTSIVMARLLTPQETGIFSLAATAVAIGGIVREFGIGDYIVSQKEMTPEKVRAAFTVTIGVAWSIALVIALAAYPLAALYHEPGVAHVMHILCLNFMLLPLGATALAMLVKELKFDTVFVIQAASALVGAAVTVACALNGFSYTSPAWGSVASIVTTFALLLVMQPHAVMMRPGLGNLRHVLKFGGQNTMSRLVEGISTRADDFIISGMLGFHSSGILSKSNSLNAGFYTFFASAVVSVASPLMARARHAERDIFEDYRRVTLLMAAVQWLFFGLMGICAHEIILLLFGPAWLEAVPILQIGAIQGLIYSPFMLCTPLLTAYGAMGAQLRVNLVFGVTLATCLVVGAMHSLVAAAALSVLAHVVRLLLLAAAAHRLCGISTMAIVRGMGPTAVIGLGAAAAAWAGRSLALWLQLPLVLNLALAMGCGALACLALAVVFKHPLALELNKLRHRRAIAPGTP